MYVLSCSDCCASAMFSTPISAAAADDIEISVRVNVCCVLRVYPFSLYSHVPIRFL
jgi:hypothetical protein